MMLMSLLTLLFSGLRHVMGWIIWCVLIAAISIGTALPAFRPEVVDGFKVLLYNDSLLKGFLLTISFALVFSIGGWLFTRRRFI